MMGAAYALSGPIPFLNTVSADSTEELLKEYAAKDTDADGLADWQEALYGTDPNNPSSFQAGITDGQARDQGLLTPKSVATAATSTPVGPIPGSVVAPTTLTDRFARELFIQHFSSRGDNPPTEEEVLLFVQGAVAELEASGDSSDAFLVSDVILAEGTGPTALLAYIASADSVLAQHATNGTKDDIEYFTEAVQKTDAASIQRVRDISTAYRAIAEGLMRIAVPREAISAHLATANALMRMSEATSDLAAIKNDPLRALLGMGLYQRAEVATVAAFVSLYQVFANNSITLMPGQAGYSFWKILQVTATTPSSVTQ